MGLKQLFVQHRMVYALVPLVTVARAKARIVHEHLLQFVVVGCDVAVGQIEYGQRHAAADVYTHAVGNDRVVCCKDAADRQSIALVRVGHQGARHRHG